MPSIGTVINYAVIGLFMAYLIHVSTVMYQLFNPAPCVSSVSKGSSFCITPFISRGPKLELSIYTSRRMKQEIREKDLNLVANYNNFTIDKEFDRSVNVTVPMTTRKNGTLFLHVFLHPRGESPFYSQHASSQSCPLTKYAVPKTEAFNLLRENSAENISRSEVAVAHWKPRIVFSILQDPLSMQRNAIPQEIHRFIRLTPRGEYLPILFINNLKHKKKELMPLNASTLEMPLRLVYSPISIGWLRLYSTLEQSMTMLHSLGFAEKDTEEVVSLVTDSGLYLLALTVLVSMFHLLFDFLAFKNDISYWRKRNTMAGLSTRTGVFK